MSADLTPTKAGAWHWRFLADRGYDCAVYVCEGAGGRLYWRNGDMCVVVRPDDPWRGPVTPPEEVSALRAALTLAEETCGLLYEDVRVLTRAVMDSCHTLGVTEDSEDDWPKLPGAVETVVAERDRLEREVKTYLDRLEGADAAKHGLLDEIRALEAERERIGTTAMAMVAALIGWDGPLDAPEVIAAAAAGPVALAKRVASERDRLAAHLRNALALVNRAREEGTGDGLREVREWLMTDPGPLDEEVSDG